MTLREALIALLHDGADPFATFAPQPDDADPWQGWGPCSPLLAETVRQVRPRLVIEVGSFLGASAIQLAGALRDNGQDACLICVDTWLGDPAIWADRAVRPHLKITHGRPEYYRSFLANVLAAGLQSWVLPLPLPSLAAARLLTQHRLQAGVVYVDGSHEGGDVRRDLAAYWPLVAAGGAMLGDDYDHGSPLFAGLVADVDAFTRERGLTMEQHGRVVRWWTPSA